jgi:polysaccharide export outer membrane protein
MTGLSVGGAGKRSRLAAAAALALVVATGCHHAGKFIWVEAVPRAIATPEPGSTIGPGDVVSVRVWNQEANSVDRVRVRDDGRISVPFLNDVEVVGMEPAELAKRLEVKLKGFIVNPVVTVVIHERRPTRVAVVGNVVRPGLFEVEPRSGVLSALAAAGGVTPFASSDEIYVIRSGYWADDPTPARIRFRYDDLLHAKPAATGFQLRTGDAIVVE